MNHHTNWSDVLAPGLPRICVVTAVILHGLAAWFNVGNFHPDGHFQILEFANYKLGYVDDSGLPWEFFWKLRSALQPGLAFLIHSIAGIFGQDNPFTITFLLRVLSSVLGLYASIGLALYSSRWIASHRLKSWLLPACCLFWVLPFVHASFMSENWSGSFLLLGTLCIFSCCDTHRSTHLTALAGGVLLGLSLYLRFPVGFAILGLAAWVLFIARPAENWPRIAVLGFLLAVLLNTLLDYWLYAEWVITPLRYFESNIIHGRAAEFGIDPWWYYVPRLFGVLLPPWSVVLLPAIVLAIYNRPRNPLVWMFSTFLIAHSIVGHKETRFLIPIINLLPILLLIGLDSIREPIRGRMRNIANGAIGKAFIASFVILNLLLMLIVSVIPAHQSARIQSWLYQQAKEEKIRLFVYDRDPYEQAGLIMNYYVSPAVRVEPVSDGAELCSKALQAGIPVRLFLPDSSLPPELQVECLQWERETTSIDYLAWIPLPGERLKDAGVWSIFVGRANR